MYRNPRRNRRFLRARRRKVDAGHLQSKFKLALNLGLGVSEEKEEQGKTTKGSQGSKPTGQTYQRGKLTFGLGWNSIQAGETAPPFALVVDVLPASQLRIAHLPDTAYVLRDGRLSVIQKDFAMVIDGSSGRLLQFTLRSAMDKSLDNASKKDKAEKIEKIEPTVLQISVESGAFDRQLKEVRKMASRYANDYDPQARLASFCGFISDEESAWKMLLSQPGDEETLAQLRALWILTNRYVMSSIVDLYERIWEMFPDDFPADVNCPDNEFTFTNMTPQMGVHVAMLGCDACFPRIRGPGRWCASLR